MKNKSFALFKKAIGLIWSCDRRYFILKIVQSIYEGVYNTIGLFMLKNNTMATIYIIIFHLFFIHICLLNIVLNAW